MTKFTINSNADLTDAETKKLKAAFTDFEARATKLKILSESIEKYFDDLYQLGDDMNNEFGSTAENIEYDGEEFYPNEDNPTAGAANTFGFWLPSSMEC